VSKVLDLRYQVSS